MLEVEKSRSNGLLLTQITFMNTSNEFYEAMKNFIMAQKLIDYGDIYWKTVTQGVIIMMIHRDKGLSKEDMIVNYEKLRLEISEMQLTIIVNDFCDELLAVLIHAYPQPDFWTATIDDYKVHPNFKEYF